MLPHSRHRQTLIAPLVATLLAGAEEARRNRVSHQQRGQLRVLMTSAANVLLSEPLFGIACPPLVIARAPSREHFPTFSCASRHGLRSRRFA